MTSRRRRPQLNPAFAAAHSLNEAKASSDGNSRSKRIDLIISQARKTGKVQSANANLTSLDPLLKWPPVAVDLSLDTTSFERKYAVETVTLLDVSDNSLGDDGTCFEDGRLEKYYRSLQTLRAKRCELSFSALRVQAVKQLHTLDLSGNKLTIFALQLLPASLRTLDLSSNQLIDLHSLAAAEIDCAVQLPHLVHLNISENNLTTVPTFIAPQLQALYCGKNKLTSLDFLLETTSLETLDAPNNLLSALADALVSDATPLVSLNLTNNRLKSIDKLPSTLVRLVGTDNSLTQVNGITNCQATLVDLLLGGNKLAELPEGLNDKCVRLKTLDLQGNDLQDLPYQLGFLHKTLQTLLVEGNPVRRLRSAVSDLKDTEAILRVLRNRAPVDDEGLPSSGAPSKTSSRLTSFLVGSKTLSFENKKLLELPADVLADLQRQPPLSNRIDRLVLTNNQIANIPDEWMRVLSNGLKTLEAHKNQLTCFPTMESNSRLTELYFSCNRLRNIQQFPLLSSLQVLDLSWNRPADDEFRCTLPPALRVLNLAGNKLVSIHLEGKLPASLEILDLSDNRLQTLDDDLPLDLIAHCPNLNTLMLQNNELSSIPLQLGLLCKSNLKHLDLRGNAQRAIRYAILEKPCSDQLSYLQNRMTPEQLTKAQEEVNRKRSGDTSALPNSDVLSPATTPATDECSHVNLDPALQSEPQAPIAESHAAKKHVPVSTEMGKHVRIPFASQQDVSCKTTTAVNQQQQQPGYSDKNHTKSAEPTLTMEPACSPLDELRETVNILSGELENNRSLSQAKRYAVKKNLAMARSKLIREERKLKQLQH